VTFSVARNTGKWRAGRMCSATERHQSARRLVYRRNYFLNKTAVPLNKTHVFFFRNLKKPNVSSEENFLHQGLYKE